MDPHNNPFHSFSNYSSSQNAFSLSPNESTDPPMPNVCQPMMPPPQWPNPMMYQWPNPMMSQQQWSNPNPNQNPMPYPPYPYWGPNPNQPQTPIRPTPDNPVNRPAGYFTSLLGQSEPPEQDEPVMESGSSKPTKKAYRRHVKKKDHDEWEARGYEKWTIEEEEDLTVAWIATIEDPNAGKFYKYSFINCLIFIVL